MQHASFREFFQRLFCVYELCEEAIIDVHELFYVYLLFICKYIFSPLNNSANLQKHQKKNTKNRMKLSCRSAESICIVFSNGK